MARGRYKLSIYYRNPNSTIGIYIVTAKELYKFKTAFINYQDARSQDRSNYAEFKDIESGESIVMVLDGIERFIVS